jgi:pheromone shutdown protein TraB
VTGVYFQVAWDNMKILGWLVFISMFITGIVGIFMKRKVKHIGIRNWRVLNIVLSALAIELITFHMITIGTDLTFVRALF